MYLFTFKLCLFSFNTFKTVYHVFVFCIWPSAPCIVHVMVCLNFLSRLCCLNVSVVYQIYFLHWVLWILSVFCVCSMINLLLALCLCLCEFSVISYWWYFRYICCVLRVPCLLMSGNWCSVFNACFSRLALCVWFLKPNIKIVAFITFHRLLLVIYLIFIIVLPKIFVSSLHCVW